MTDLTITAPAAVTGAFCQRLTWEQAMKNVMTIASQEVAYDAGMYAIPVLHVGECGLAQEGTYAVHVHDGELCPYHGCDPFVIEQDGDSDYRLSIGTTNVLIVSGAFLDELATLLKFKLPEVAAV